MATFKSGDAEIAYSVHGEGLPCVLLHGFCGTAADNFVRTGWVGALTKAGRQTILMDARGHGQSAKFYDPKDYAQEHLVSDVVNLLDHLKLDTAEFVGFSMGGMISLATALEFGERIDKLALMGLGDAMWLDRADPAEREEMAAVFEADDGQSISGRGKLFRLYAEKLGQDLRALAASYRAPREPPDLPRVAQLSMPILFVSGSRDAIAGGFEHLQNQVPQAQFSLVPGLSHDATLAHALAKMEVLEFLTGGLA